MRRSNLLYPGLKWVRSCLNISLIVMSCYLGPTHLLSSILKWSYLFGVGIVLLYFIPTRLRPQVWENVVREYRTKALISIPASVIVNLLELLIIFFWSNWSPFWVLIVGIYSFLTVYVLHAISNLVKETNTKLDK